MLSGNCNSLDDNLLKIGHVQTKPRVTPRQAKRQRCMALHKPETVLNKYTKIKKKNTCILISGMTVHV